MPGANDVISKPIQLDAVLAWLKRLLEQAVASQNSPLRDHFEVADIAVDLVAQRVSVRGREVPLSSSEFSLLTALIHRAGQVVTYRFLTHQIWNSGARSPF